MGTRIPKQRLIFRNCMCGNLNEVYISSKVHNRIEHCKICNEWSIKKSQLMAHQNSNWFMYYPGSIEQFALAWG